MIRALPIIVAIATAIVIAAIIPAYAQEHIPEGCGVDIEWVDDMLYYGTIRADDGVFNAGEPGTEEIVEVQGSDILRRIVFKDNEVCIFMM